MAAKRAAKTTIRKSIILYISKYIRKYISYIFENRANEAKICKAYRKYYRIANI
jgi:hypothetical protein